MDKITIKDLRMNFFLFAIITDAFIVYTSRTL